MEVLESGKPITESKLEMKSSLSCFFFCFFFPGFLDPLASRQIAR